MRAGGGGGDVGTGGRVDVGGGGRDVGDWWKGRRVKGGRWSVKGGEEVGVRGVVFPFPPLGPFFPVLLNP